MSELSEVKDALNALAGHMESSLPEERVKAILESTQAEEARSRRRVRYLLYGVSVIVAVVLIVGAVLLTKISDSIDEAKVTSHYVKECLQKPAAERDPNLCGPDGSKIIQGLVSYMNCAFLILPAERTEAKLNACAARAFTP